MAWTYSTLKWRAALRAKYTEETGKSDYSSPAFEAWLVARGEIQS